MITAHEQAERELIKYQGRKASHKKATHHLRKAILWRAKELIEERRLCGGNENQNDLFAKAD